MPHWQAAAALQVGDTADVGAEHALGLQRIQVAQFAVAQLLGQIRVEHAVGARRAAAKVRLIGRDLDLEAQVGQVLFHTAFELLAVL